MAKPGKHMLVREYIEKMSGTLLEAQYRGQLADLIRGHAGIYALYRKDELYYVGLATDLMRRVRQHLVDHHQGEWDRFSVYLTSRDEHIKPLESLLLRVLQPVGNSQRGKLPDAVDRKRSLERMMREQDAQKRSDLLHKHLPAPAKPRTTLARKQASKPRPASIAALVRRADKGLPLERTISLQAHYKGDVFHAVMNRDGTVRHAGIRYPSLSAAGIAVTGRNCNGWHFWRACDASGEWVVMDTFRR